MTDQPPSEPIAIIGMACIFPGAPNLQRYWDNIVNGVDAIGEVPEQRWASVFYDPDSGEVDRFYCRRGGFVDDYVDFDPLKYGVMPRAAASADPDQLLSLRIGIEALEDAGYASREFPRERCGVIIGRGNYLSAGTLRLEQHVRLVQQLLQTLQELFPALAEEQLQAVREQIRSKLDYYGPDVAIGMIPNLVASRLANRLDLQGPAYTVDAACASSLLAIEQACESLRARQTDMMLAGGLHFTHDLTFWATFCQLGALSRSQVVRPFSADADGILAGEGIGMLVLKRQADAERDGDRIYALINGVASASDGRSSSLMAPSVSGQLLALQRAWQQTDLQRDRLGLLEAHGTGTPAGDQAELQTVQAFFGAWQPGADEGLLRPVLGSVKSMIGHTMPGSGRGRRHQGGAGRVPRRAAADPALRAAARAACCDTFPRAGQKGAVAAAGYAAYRRRECLWLRRHQCPCGAEPVSAALRSGSCQVIRTIRTIRLAQGGDPCGRQPRGIARAPAATTMGYAARRGQLAVGHH